MTEPASSSPTAGEAGLEPAAEATSIGSSPGGPPPKAPGLFPFLWRYFRRYGALITIALAATFTYALATVTLLPVFKLILSEVIRTDQAVVPELDESEESGAKAWLEKLLGRDLDLDFDALIDRGFAAVLEALDLTIDDAVWFLPMIFCAVFVARSASAFLTGYLFQLVGLGATNDLRDDLYQRILNQSSQFFDRHPSGELVSRIGNDIGVMQNAVSSRMLDLVQQSITLVFLIVFLFVTNARLALVCIVAIPLVVYPIVRFGQGMRRASRDTQERLADLSSLVAEVVRGYPVVKAFAMEDFELGRFRRASRNHLRVKLRAQLLAKASSPVIETLVAVGAALFLFYVGSAVRGGTLTPSQVMTFLTNLVMLYDPIRKLNGVNLNLQEALAAVQRVRDLMLVPNDVEERPDAVELGDVEPRIELEGVTFSYRRGEGHDRPVLRDVDLTIEPGEMVALVGPSGAGKSTLANLLPRFFDPAAGKVLIGGHDLRSVTLVSLRAMIGIVTQDTMLFNDTVRANIAYGRDDLALEKVAAAAAAAYADEFIERLPDGYDTTIGESGTSLSGGQRQRLAIARAVLKDPPILIFDEATSHLDSEAEALVQSAIYNLMVGRTALVIAHRLSTVQRADRILAMEDGQVVEQGTHAELLERGGLYRRLHELQFQDI